MAVVVVVVVIKIPKKIIRIQTAIRRFSAFRKYEEAVGAAISIQNVIRICLAQLNATNAIALKFLLSESTRWSKKDAQAVCCIEKVFRAYKVRQAKLFFVSARKVQTQWRCYMAVHKYVSRMNGSFQSAIVFFLPIADSYQEERMQLTNDDNTSALRVKPSELLVHSLN